MAKLKKKIPDGFTDLCYGRSNGPWTPEEMAVKWVSLNSNPIQLGRVSYKR